MSATNAPDQHDEHSHANPWEVRVTHVALDLVADFQAHVLAGTATLSLEAMPAATAVVVDTKDLTIERVTSADGTPLRHTVGPEDQDSGPGAAYRPSDRPPCCRHHLSHQSAGGGAAMAGAGPDRRREAAVSVLAGRVDPHADVDPDPGQPRHTPDLLARIVAPRALDGGHERRAAHAAGRRRRRTDGAREFPFRLEPSVAPVSDRPRDRRAGRSSPWVRDRRSMPSRAVVDRRRGIPTWNDGEAAESMRGPYRWGRYDILVLPPSFPFGGMENPRLTFATPTVLAGDRSLVSLSRTSSRTPGPATWSPMPPGATSG